MKTILVAGTNSGVGKTSIAVGLMAAFCRRGLRVQPFKVGPDFLDPMHHKAATGRDSYNLDGWMLSREVNLACFMRCTPFTDIAIVEGVMGLYDGRDGKSDSGSTAEMAKLLGTPVLLVLDCWQLARSAAALIRGYTSFDPDVKFAGVLLNKVGGSSHTAWLTEAILATERDVRVLGGVPKSAGIELPERHLGVHPPADEEVPVNYIQRLADLIESHVDLDSILEQAVPFESVHGDILANPSLDLICNTSVAQPKPVRIGVARDDAFCFYYHENLLLLQNAGAELVEFSPLRDTLPPRLDGIYFGGGYPELHLEELSSNKRLLYGIRAFANAGGVIFAECGGLMYLSQGIEDDEQHKWSMCGVFPFWTRMQPVMHMGYVTVTPQDNCVLFPASIGEIRGQIYHFSEMFYANSNTINLCPKGFCTKAEYRKAAEDVEGYMHGNTMASFVHLHFGSNPAAALSFVERCRMDSTKAAAVAAASASAVAGAGPVAAAAAGAAAAAAVAEAMGETNSLIPYQSVGDNSDLFLRRSGSFDLSSMRQHYEGRRNNGRLVRSESEIWVGQLDQENNSYSNLGGEITRSEDYNRRVATKAGFASATGKAYNARDDVEDISSNIRGRHGNVFENNLDKDNTVVQGRHRKNLPPLTANRRTFGWLVNGELPKHLEKVPSGSRFSSSSPTSRALPERIVSLSPSATEILYELGAGKRLIGVTESCIRPSGSTNELYIVCRTKVEPGSRLQTYVEVPKSVGTLGKGSSMRLDVSWLCKAKPDLIIIQDSSLHGDTCSTPIVGILAQAGLQSGKNTHIMILRPHTVADAMSSIVELGDRVGLYHEACLLADWLRSRLRKAAAAVARLHRPRVLVLHCLDPLIMGGHWVPEMESLAGGLDDLQKPGCNAETLLWRRITNYAPEVLIFALLTSSAEKTLSEVQKIVKLSGFWSLPAVEAGRVYICEHFFFSYPGTKLVDGVERLVGMLHPSASQSWQVPGAVLKLSLTHGQKCSPDQISKHFQPC
ncbi:hypothetical protein Mapa_008444 [Marchantia paleacea]|nr:hypothetical protein Mapa_008444 [Marchantia paleacea]